MSTSQKKNTLKVPHGASEGDISKLDPENPLLILTRRQKRPRNEILVNSDEDIVGPSLKEELLEMLTNWKKDQDAALTRLSRDIAELKTQNSKIQATNVQLEQTISFMSSQYEDMRAKLISFENERKESRSHIASLELKIEDLQKRSKFTVVEIRNVPTVPHQSVKRETQQDLTNLIQKTCAVLGVDIQSGEIKDVYSIKTKSGSSTIVTELTTVVSRNKILRAAKEYNKCNPNSKLTTTTLGLPGPNMPVYIAESLTNKDRKLFAMAREAQKSLEYKYCWTNQGRIYLRKAEGSARIEIRSESDLVSLKNK